MQWYKSEGGSRELLGYDPATDSVFHVAVPEEEGEPFTGRFLPGEITNPDDEFEAESVGELREIADAEIADRTEHPPTYAQPEGGGGFGSLVGLGLLAGLGYGLWRLWKGDQAQSQQPQLPAPASQPYTLPGR